MNSIKNKNTMNKKDLIYKYRLYLEDFIKIYQRSEGARPFFDRMIEKEEYN